MHHEHMHTRTQTDRQTDRRARAQPAQRLQYRRTGTTCILSSASYYKLTQNHMACGGQNVQASKKHTVDRSAPPPRHITSGKTTPCLCRRMMSFLKLISSKYKVPSATPQEAPPANAATPIVPRVRTDRPASIPPPPAAMDPPPRDASLEAMLAALRPDPDPLDKTRPTLPTAPARPPVAAPMPVAFAVVASSLHSLTSERIEMAVSAAGMKVITPMPPVIPPRPAAPPIVARPLVGCRGSCRSSSSSSADH
mmetsp:Transcript_31707/g.78559  ORF Transcript_31707/g.78559 Transcript_31707/m.78559 type:complete len:252 (-) Transcript_31707:587-1342(-)